MVMKLAKQPKQWTDAEKRQLASLARQGLAAYEIAAALGRHVTSVRRMARDMGILLWKASSN
jgi:hypothetical protein